MKRYLIIASIMSVVLLVAYYSFNDMLFQSYLHQQFPALVVFFFVQSLVVSWMLRSAEKSEGQFALFALGSIVFRFMTGIFFVIIYWMIGVSDIIALVIQFGVLYLVYLVFELSVVLANLRRN